MSIISSALQESRGKCGHKAYTLIYLNHGGLVYVLQNHPLHDIKTDLHHTTVFS
jgi:hypothetical protein